MYADVHEMRESASGGLDFVASFSLPDWMVVADQAGFVYFFWRSKRN